jgi:CDP-glucose 4,6-dehydratase
LIQWLHQLGARVHGYALPPTAPDGQTPLFLAANLEKCLVSHTIGDIQDLELFQKTWQESQADVLFHLAAQALVRESYRDPLATFKVNILGTAVVLEAVRLTKRPAAVVVITSDKCYQNQEQLWGYREIDALGGRDPYSASKGAAEIVARSYRDSFFPLNSIGDGVRLATARAGNVIGGGDWSVDRLVPDLVRALRNNQPALIRNPYASRPWQHVLEPLSGYLTLAERLIAQPRDPRLRAAWNFGPEPGDAWTVGRMADYFCHLWGPNAEWVDASIHNAPHEANLLRLAIDQARALLDWTPKWDVKKAVAKTAAWYQASTRPGFDAWRACQADLFEYLNLT